MAYSARHTTTSNRKVAAKPAPKKGNVSKAAPISKTKRQAKQIINALHEAEQIYRGKRKSISLDEFLEEL